MGNRLFIEKERLIEILNNYPGKYSYEDLRRKVNLSPPTIKKVVQDNNIADMIKPRKITKIRKPYTKRGGYDGLF